MRDLEGGESAGIERVRGEFLRISDLYGYSYVDPSPLEFLSTLETRSGPAIRDEIYHFTDKGNRQVALRFDFTMGLARRAVSQRSQRLPSKVSSFGGVFRYDEPQKGRYRYFHQWDVEVFGRPTVETDAEIIEMTSVLFESLGLQNVTIDVCHRRLVESKIEDVFGAGGVDNDNYNGNGNGNGNVDGRTAAILRAIDKTAKKPRQVILNEFWRYPSEKLESILEFAGIRGSIAHVEDATDVSDLDSWDYMVSLFDSLERRGVPNARVNLGIVRGLDYYSGMVFEAFVEDSSGGSLAGGGRYDALTGAFGREDLGAAGVAGGVERTVLAMREQNLLSAGDGPHNRTVAVLYATEDTRREAASISSSLRRAGIRTEFDLVGRSLKKQLGDAAARIDADVVIIVGPEELAAGNVVLRQMDSGKEHAASLDELRNSPMDVLGRQSGR